jgi:hypothetical protein
LDASDLPATPLTAALAHGSLASYGLGTVRLPPAPPEVSPAAVAVLGWLVPGMGQVATGRRRAGLALFLVIMSLFVGGLTLADFSCVDPQRHRLEFVAHVLIGGPTFSTVALTAGRRSSAPPRWRDLGSLYVIVSGFLNLIAVCSALSEAARRNEEGRKKHEEAVSLALAVARLQALARRPAFDEHVEPASAPLLMPPAEVTPPAPASADALLGATQDALGEHAGEPAPADGDAPPPEALASDPLPWPSAPPPAGEGRP